MKDGLTLILRSGLTFKKGILYKDCECRQREMKKWKQNWDEVFEGEVRKEREKKEREKGKRKIEGREKTK
jgi:hypothetical protein